MSLPKDWREFFELLNAEGVEYLLVGALALAYHGHPRYTDDVDILFRSSPENAARLAGALRKFGFEALGLSAPDFLEPHSVVQLGYPPNRIDLMNSLSGVANEEAWSSRVAGDLDGIPVFYLSRDAYVRNKRACGRLKDKADLEALGEEAEKA
jgi:hypothetical protein